MDPNTYMDKKNAFPRRIHSGYWPEGHVQGIAIDEARGYIYYSFTGTQLNISIFQRFSVKCSASIRFNSSKYARRRIQS